MLALEKLSVGYPGTRGAVLSNVSLKAEPGVFVCILGRNGAGKSTLMRTVAGLQAPLAGLATLEGEAIATMRAATRARRVAVVLTERQFSPGLKVEDVVSLGRQPYTGWQGRLSADDWKIADLALEQLNATAFRGRYFDDLSDGERQRVMIARAIAQTPRLMVLDEITAFLDLPGRVEIMSLLRRHGRETGAAILLSSHDLDLSLQLADEIWLLDGKGGLKIGAPDALSRSGAVGEAFDTLGVAFSPDLGRFELRG
jgi:iron complex transport system ATP-binding protein